MWPLCEHWPAIGGKSSLSVSPAPSIQRSLLHLVECSSAVFLVMGSVVLYVLLKEVALVLPATLIECVMFWAFERGKSFLVAVLSYRCRAVPL